MEEEMECEECEEWEEHHYWKHQDPKGKLFFRVMRHDFQQSMRIPKKFANHLKEELSETVHLKDPSGIAWHVELSNNLDGTFLSSGWNEFAKAHCLKENDLLIFEYQGNSCFKIKMLEASGCEKAHSHCLKIKDSLLKQGTRGVFGSSSSSDNDLLHEQPDPPPRMTRSRCRKRISTSNELSGQTKNMPKNNNNQSFDARKHARRRTKQESDDLDGYVNIEGLNKQENIEELSKQELCVLKKISLTAEEEKRAFSLAHAVCSGNPYFISVMRPTYIDRGDLRIPFRFKAYLPSKNSWATLKVWGMRKKWRVGFFTRTFGFGANWKCFVRDNGLVEGDICLFELISNHKENIEMRVRISRARGKTVSFGEKRT